MPDESLATEKHAIHGYVCPGIHAQFETYRRELGLTSSSALLTFLVLREIKVRRLSAAVTRARAGQPRNAKVSAYIDAGKAQAFRELIDELGRSASDCAADLVTRELEERWLESALKMTPVPVEDVG